jgi:CxxC motif-containing protein (DUF1111 family)
MRRAVWPACGSALLLGVLACARSPGDELAAGEAATVLDATRDAFSQPAPGLSEAHRARFFVGNSFFNQSWVTAPASVATRDGLGPLFNARSCSACHFKDGRGRPPEPGEAPRSLLLRVSVPGTGAHAEPLHHPVYGDQIQGNATGSVPPEANVSVEYEETGGRYASGEEYSLRRPSYVLSRLGYGPVPRDLRVSPRVAPALVGLGLLEAVPEEELAALEDPDDDDGDGVAGRSNRVWDRSKGAKARGRFGWKAEQPTLLQQSAAAFLGDMGITSSLFPAENHTRAQSEAAMQPSGGVPEVGAELLASVVLYVQALGVPARRNLQEPAVRRGEQLFDEAGCSKCHVPTLRSEPRDELSELGRVTIHPYTDLLLHDMGEGLADGRPSYEASGRHWRTPPLWGLGLIETVNGHTLLLHDGRARNASEAILWHGGEAQAARDAFVSLPREERSSLLAFLASL